MLILNGRSLATPFRSISYQEDPRFRVKDRSARPTRWIRGIVFHTTQGRFPQPTLAGFGTGGSALANIKYWNRDPKYASAHLLVDRDGVVYQTADLIAEQTIHAEAVNGFTIGIEICQGGNGSIYSGQYDVSVALADWLTGQDEIAVQRQIPAPYTGHPVKRLVAGGRDVVGVYGHRDQTAGRGRGDPGDVLMEELVGHGYERFDFDAGEDLKVWKARQVALGLTAGIDGIPGPKTVAALKAAGKPGGIWVVR